MSSGLESKPARINSEQMLSKRVTKSATCKLEVYEQMVNISSAAGVVTITMPAVSEAAGKFYTLFVTDATNKIFVLAPDSGDFPQPNMDEANDGVVFYSDGVHWWNCDNRGGSSASSASASPSGTPSATPSTSPSGTPSATPSASPSASASASPSAS